MKSLIECLVKLGKSFGKRFNVVLASLAIFLIKVYKLVVSPWLGPACRFDPSCSQYAVEAFQTRPPLKALLLTLKRLSKCHPFGSFGYDPLPPKESPSC